jgi:tetratricopeptide (TPR) repeat protein
MGAFHGVFLPGVDLADAGARLGSLIAHVAQVFSTRLGVIALFQSAITLDPAEIGYALALRRSARGGWATYPDHQTDAADTLFVYLQGQAHQIKARDWVHGDVMDLWHLATPNVVRMHAVPLRPLAKPAAPVVLKRDAVIADIVTAPPPLADIKQALETTPPSRDTIARSTFAFAGRFVRFLVALAVFACVIGFVVLLFAGLAAGSGGLALLILVVFVLGRWIRNLLAVAENRPVQPSPAQGRGAGQAPAQGAGRQPQSPGMWHKLNSWLLWKTPLGNNLRQQIEDRLRETERLLKQGRIDEALKRAIAAADRDAANARLSTRLADTRTNLDLSFSARRAGGSIPMGGQSHQALRKRYRELAQSCEDNGDYRRAAFIWDELLGDAHSAVGALEKAKLYKEAAKLAMARNLPGGDVVRLWYQAGQRDVAIALAKRYGALGDLVAHATHKNREAGLFMRRIWAVHLAELGEYTHAIEVAEDIPNFDAVRLKWFAIAIAEGELADDDFFHKAVVTLPWDHKILTGQAPYVGGDHVGGQLERRLYDALWPGNDTHRDMQPMLDFLVAYSKKGPQKDAFFKTARAAGLVDILIRRVLADGRPVTKKDLAAFRHLARDAGASVLSSDLAMIRRKAPVTGSIGEEKAFRLLPVPPGSPKWAHVICLPRGRFLLADQAGLVRLVNINGKIEWADRLTDFAAMVRINAGRHVLFILGRPGQARRIVRFDTLQHSYTPVGHLDLTVWHDCTSEQIWMVQSGNRIAAISVAALFEDTPDLREAWGITLNEPFEVRVFVMSMSGQAIYWYLQRLRPNGGYGLLEYWHMGANNLRLNTYICEPPTGQITFADPYKSVTVAHEFSLFDLYAAPSPKPTHMRNIPFSWDELQRINSRHFHYLRSLDGPAPIRQYGHGLLWGETPKATTPLIRLSKQKHNTRAQIEGVGWLASDMSHDKGFAALIDSDHRVSFIDMGDLQVTPLR